MGQRFHYLFAVLFALASLMGSSLAQADDVQLQKVRNLENLGEEARDRNLPILLMFSMNGCPYCVILEQDYLLPMLRSGQYGDKVLIRMVMVDDYASLTDFNGKRIEAEDLPTRYGAYVTPTMVFLNAEAKRSHHVWLGSVRKVSLRVTSIMQLS